MSLAEELKKPQCESIYRGRYRCTRAEHVDKKHQFGDGVVWEDVDPLKIPQLIHPEELDNYQVLARATAGYPDVGNNFVYPALGLAGEAGEVAEKIKKLWRDKGIIGGRSLDNTLSFAVDKEAIVKEMGDVLWYVAALANELDVSLSEVAQANINKLYDRRNREVLHGEGDNR